MDEFTDDIYYSILANAPYLLEQGQSLEQLEESIQNDYQLDYSIDRDLSDSKSIVFKSKKDNEVVHSIRGTATMEDLITDASLMEKLLTHLPTYPQLYTTIGATAGVPLFKPATYYFFEKDRPTESKQIIDDLIEKTLQSLQDPQDLINEGVDPESILSIEEVKEFIKGLEEDKTIFADMLRQHSLRNVLPSRKKMLGLASIIPASYLAGKAIGGIQKYRFPDGVKNPRIIEEQAKFDKIKSKYPDANFVFTGHSLGGSVSNYLSRQHGHKAITFNPAPQLELADQFHKDSKIYKTRADFASLVSIFDKEQRRLVPQKVLRPHSLSNFIPPKIARRTIVPKVERQKAFFEKPPKKCLENPELPECKSYYYV